MRNKTMWAPTLILRIHHLSNHPRRKIVICSGNSLFLQQSHIAMREDIDVDEYIIHRIPQSIFIDHEYTLTSFNVQVFELRPRFVSDQISCTLIF